MSPDALSDPLPGDVYDPQSYGLMSSFAPASRYQTAATIDTTTIPPHWDNVPPHPEGPPFRQQRPPRFQQQSYHRSPRFPWQQRSISPDSEHRFVRA